MILENKKINFLGDSITYGYSVSNTECRFSDLIKKEYNLAESRNYGISGTRIARQQHNFNKEYPEVDRDFCSRVSDMDKEADIVVVFGGVNDYAHGDAPIGNPGDTTPNTFYGACNRLYTDLKDKFPDSFILIITPLHILNDCRKGGDIPKIKEPLVLSDYVTAIKQTAKIHDLEILDLFNLNELDPNNNQINQALFSDGIHPNDAGHKKLAEIISKKLCTF